MWPRGIPPIGFRLKLGCLNRNESLKISLFNSLRLSDTCMHQYNIPTLLHIMAWHLFGAKPLSETMLHIVNWTLRNIFQWNFIQNSKIFIQGNTLKNVCGMAAILSWPHYMLTHCGQVRPHDITDNRSTVGQVMACLLFGTKPLT